jgi:methionyl-tRNA synthetase
VGHKNDWKPNVYGQVKSWIDGGLEPRAVTRDLIEIDVPVEPKEKNYMYGLMRRLAIFHLQRMGFARRKKWEPYWKIKTVGSLYRKTILFSLCIISLRC